MTRNLHLRKGDIVSVACAVVYPAEVWSTDDHEDRRIYVQPTGDLLSSAFSIQEDDVLDVVCRNFTVGEHVMCDDSPHRGEIIFIHDRWLLVSEPHRDAPSVWPANRCERVISVQTSAASDVAAE